MIIYEDLAVLKKNRRKVEETRKEMRVQELLPK